MASPLPEYRDSPRVRSIDIGKEFSPVLGPRSKDLGPHSGQLFFETVLEPAFLDPGADVLAILLDSIRLASASFFEEAFGGLVRKYGLRAVEKKLRFTAIQNAFLVPKIQSWMHSAEFQR